MARIVKPNPPGPAPQPPPEPAPVPAPIPVVVTGSSPYRELGNTTREAFKQAMSRTVAGAVPFAGDLDAMYDELALRGVTRLAPPMSWMECKNSTWPTCGVPTRCRNPWSVTGEGDAGSSGRWASYSSYRVAARVWADLVINGSPYRSARSIADFIHIYAPASDNNDEAAYVNVIVEGVNALPLSGDAPPKPKPTGDVLYLLYGGKPFAITASYGQLVTWRCDGCYDYFADYGLDTRHHWAYDVSAAAGEGAPLYAPFDGTVVCAGTGIGRGAWGTGCAAFPRLNNYGGKPAGQGAGRLELLHADGDRSLILGHVLSSRPRAGDRVKAGDLIGQQGGMNASHVHVEGRYANGTRIGDPRKLFGGGPLQDAYADPVEIAQPDDVPPFVTVRAIRATPVLQRGNPASSKILPDLAAGDTFFAQHQVLGGDGRWYYVGRLLGRVAVADTELVETTLP